MLPVHRQGNAESGSLSQRGHPLQLLRQRFDNLFGRLLGDWFPPALEPPEEMRFWDFDMTDHENEVVVRAELPGFEANDLDVQLNNDILTIRAEKSQETGQEQSFNSFRRSVTLPAGIDAENVKATYKNGVLEMHIPKTEKARPKRIPVEGQQAQAGNGNRMGQAQGEEVQVSTAQDQKREGKKGS